MPSTEEKMRRKRLLQKYKDGVLSEKSKASLGFPPGKPKQDLEPLWDKVALNPNLKAKKKGDK